MIFKSIAVMNKIIKQELPDIGKVCGVNIAALFIANQKIIQMGQPLQEIGGTIAIWLGIIYTIAKLYKLIRNLIWSRRDRKMQQYKDSNLDE